MLIIFISCLATISLGISVCNGQTNLDSVIRLPDTPPLPVWTTINARTVQDDGTPGVEQTHLSVCGNCISEMTAPVKTIIARYASFLPGFLLNAENELVIAQALGGFSSLQEARQALLKDWTGEDILRGGFNYNYLGLKIRGDTLFVTDGKGKTDKFIIDKNGKITALIRAASQLRDYKQLINAVNQSLKIDPQNASSYGNLSYYYLYTQDYEKSEQSALKGLSIDGTKLWIKGNLATALLFQGKYEEAEKIVLELKSEICLKNKTCAQTWLDDFDRLEQAGAIPESQKENVEKCGNY